MGYKTKRLPTSFRHSRSSIQNNWIKTPRTPDWKLQSPSFQIPSYPLFISSCIHLDIKLGLHIECWIWTEFPRRSIARRSQCRSREKSKVSYAAESAVKCRCQTFVQIIPISSRRSFICVGSMLFKSPWDWSGDYRVMRGEISMDDLRMLCVVK